MSHQQPLWQKALYWTQVCLIVSLPVTLILIWPHSL